MLHGEFEVAIVIVIGIIVIVIITPLTIGITVI